MTAKHYGALEKLEAVERAMGLCKRSAPAMIARGALTTSQVSTLMNILADIALDYRSQTIDDQKAYPKSCSRLSATLGSDNFTRHNVD